MVSSFTTKVERFLARTFGIGRRDFGSRRVRRDAMRPRPSMRAGLTTLLALILAYLSFLQTGSAQLAQFPAPAIVGSSFQPWQGATSRLAIEYMAKNGQVDGAAFRAMGERLVAASPASAEGWRLFAWGLTDPAATERRSSVMVAAERFSRRDLLTQQWLMANSATTGDVEGTLTRFDRLMRTAPADARADILRQIAPAIADPRTRLALRPVLHKGNPWFDELANVAGANPQLAVPLARLIAENRQIEHQPNAVIGYSRMVRALADQRQFRTLATVYPLLPGALSADLASVALTRRLAGMTYAPVNWLFVNSPDYGSSIVVDGPRMAINAYAEPLTRGEVARKLVYTGGRSGRISWTIIERGGGERSEAVLALRCPGLPTADSLTRTRNLITERVGQPMSLHFPSGCPVVEVVLVMAGGSGPDPADISISNPAIRFDP